MIIKIEQGSVGLWYASTEDAPAPYRGLFLTGNSCAEVLDDLSSTLKHLRELASTITPALDAAIQDEIEHGPASIMKE